MEQLKNDSNTPEWTWMGKHEKQKKWVYGLNLVPVPRIGGTLVAIKLVGIYLLSRKDVGVPTQYCFHYL